jgi:hypothetical protein
MKARLPAQREFLAGQPVTPILLAFFSFER